MIPIDKKGLITSLGSILRILRNREPGLQQFCNVRFIRRLKSFPIHVLVAKCVFILGHCTLRNLALLHRRGVFREKTLLQIVGEILSLRRVHDVHAVKALMYDFRSFQGN